MKKFLLSLSLASALLAHTYEELIKEPNSLAKDFFLYELLKEHKLSAEQLKTLKPHISRFVGVIAKEYKKQTSKQPAEPSKLLANSCWRYGYTSIINAPKHCQKLRLKDIKFSKHLAASDLLKIAKNFEKDDKGFSQTLKAYAAINPMQAAIKQGNSALVLKLYYENYKLNDYAFGPIARANFLKSPLAYKFLNSALVDDKFPLIKKSLLNAKEIPESINSDLAFAMGLNMLMHKHYKNAKSYFLAASKNYKFKRPRDNALWFAYLVSNDAAILDSLANSDDLNIYSLYAKELTGAKGFDIIVPQPSVVLEQDITDALAQARWQIELKKKSKDELEADLKKYYAKNTLGQYLATYTRLNGFSENIYPMPFSEYLKDASNDEKALIYAIAMQESRFLPASVSTSYALGMMQFMPFVARHTAKVDFGMNEFDVTKMFDPATALPFALAHVRTLKKGVNSPLFIAYAYNGGLGFTKRMLAKENMFKRHLSDLGDLRNKRHLSDSGDFEPFLSMELVPYLESRLYGKKVLANYYIYKQLLGEPIKMSELFKALDKEIDQARVSKEKQ